MHGDRIIFSYYIFDFIVFAIMKHPNKGAVIKMCIKEWIHNNFLSLLSRKV